MKNYKSNEERTAEYLKKFDRDRLLKYLVGKKDPVVIDVGANVGKTLQKFLALWPNGKFICFEPQTECLGTLIDIQNSHPDSDITVVELAAGNTDNSLLTFYSHDVSSGMSGFNKINIDSMDSIRLAKIRNQSDEFSKYLDEVNHERKIKTVRLDKYLNIHNINQVDVLKIDTQGFEAEVLEGLGQLLEKTGIVIAELMLYDYYEKSLSFSDIEKYLLPNGLSLYDISHISKNPMNGRTDWVDVIYVNHFVRTHLSDSLETTVAK